MTSSTFLNFSKHFLNQRLPGRSPPQFTCMFHANHFHIEATLETTDSDKLSKHSSTFYHFNKEGYIQSKVGSHIITGVP